MVSQRAADCFLDYGMAQRPTVLVHLVIVLLRVPGFESVFEPSSGNRPTDFFCAFVQDCQAVRDDKLYSLNAKAVAKPHLRLPDIRSPGRGSVRAAARWVTKGQRDVTRRASDEPRPTNLAVPCQFDFRFDNGARSITNVSHHAF